ncbi:acyl-coenzyme A diphosphatase FITM2-like [Styela clava]
MLDFLIKYYLIRPQFRVLFIWIGVLALSGLKEFVFIPDSYFSDSTNFFNIYIVKYNWIWTVWLVTPYAFITSFVYSCDHWKRGSVATGLRWLFLTGLFYFWTIVFDGISNLTGLCFDSARNPLLDITDKQSCMKLAGTNRWRSFEISNQAFTLTLSALVIASELQIQKYWKYISTHAAETSPCLAIGSKSLIRLKARHKTTKTTINYLFIFCSILSIFWEFSLICTCLYSHGFITKALGAAFGILSWMVAYLELFRNRSFPIYPGYGHLKSLITHTPAKENRNGVDKKKE